MTHTHGLGGDPKSCPACVEEMKMAEEMKRGALSLPDQPDWFHGMLELTADLTLLLQFSSGHFSKDGTQALVLRYPEFRRRWMEQALKLASELHHRLVVKLGEP